MTGEHGVGVVLIGNSEVYSRLQGRQQAQFAQLFSRIRMQREYTTRKVKEDDVRKLFQMCIRDRCYGVVQNCGLYFRGRLRHFRLDASRNPLKYVRCVHAAGPVSYTHLDVYKRQR